METAILVIVIFIFFILSYSFLTHKLKSFLKFDLIFTHFGISLILMRIIGIIMNLDQFGTLWSVGPLTEKASQILVFSKWPWLFLRMWDGVLDVNYVFSIMIIGLTITLYLNRKKIKNREKIYTSFALSTLLSLTILVIAQIVFKFTLIDRDISLFGIGSNYTTLVFSSIILSAVAGIKYYDRNAKLIPIILVLWSLLNVVGRLSQMKYEPHFLGVDFYYGEAILGFLLALFYFLIVVVRKDSKKNVENFKQRGSQVTMRRRQQGSLNFGRQYMREKKMEKKSSKILKKMASIFKTNRRKD